MVSYFMLYLPVLFLPAGINAYGSRKFADYSLGKFNFAQNLATLLNLRKTSRFLSLVNLAVFMCALRLQVLRGLNLKRHLNAIYSAYEFYGSYIR